jgi:hypothetical protein
MNTLLYNEAGVIFSQKDKSLLISSLNLLKTENNFKYVCYFCCLLFQISYWGKITGVKADYYIIKARNDFLGASYKYFYSINLLNWAMVPNVEPRIEWQNRLDQNLFYGDPTMKTKFLV